MARPTGRQADARQMRREKAKGHVCFVGARMRRSKRRPYTGTRGTDVQIDSCIAGQLVDRQPREGKIRLFQRPAVLTDLPLP
jgi:hypothetical protein